MFVYCLRLDGLAPNAYEAFQTSRDLRAVVNKCLRAKNGSDKGELTKSVSVAALVMTPIQPMLVRLDLKSQTCDTFINTSKK